VLTPPRGTPQQLISCAAPPVAGYVAALAYEEFNLIFPGTTLLFFYFVVAAEIALLTLGIVCFVRNVRQPEARAGAMTLFYVLPFVVSVLLAAPRAFSDASVALVFLRAGMK
jgi:hypothetical protein